MTQANFCESFSGKIAISKKWKGSCPPSSPLIPPLSGALQKSYCIDKYIWHRDIQSRVSRKFLFLCIFLFFYIVILALNSLRVRKKSTRFSGESRFLLLFVFVKLFEVFKLGVLAKLSEFQIFRINKTLGFDYII